MYALLAATAATVAAAGGVLEGTVKSPAGAPVAAAEVVLWPTDIMGSKDLRTRTDAAGAFRLGVNGESRILVLASGYAAHSEYLEEPKSPLDIVLSTGQELRVTVREAKKRRPLSGTRLEVHLPMVPDPVIVASSDASGVALLSAVGSDDAELRVKAPGYLLEVRELAAGERRAPLEIELIPGPSLELRITAPDGTPIADARADLSCSGVEETISGTSDARGRILFTSTLPCTRYDGSISAPDHVQKSFSQRPTPEPSGLQVIEVKVEPGATLAGRIVDAEDRLVPGAMVWVAGGSQMARSAPDGTFDIRGVSPGPASVYVRAEGYLLPEPLEIVVTPEGRKDLVLRLSAGRKLTGSVVDPDRRPIAGAKVNAAAGNGSGAATTADDGSFSIAGLDRGLAYVSAMAQGYQGRNLEHEGGEPLAIVLEPGARISGRVVDVDTSAAIAGAQVSAVGRAEGGGIDPERRGDVASGSDGGFEIDGLESGAYVLSADAEGYSETPGPEVRIAPGGSRSDVVVKLRRGAVVTGKVLAALDGSPLRGASVMAVSSQGMDAVVASTDDAGAFRLSGISSSFVDVTVEHPRFAREELRGVSVAQASTVPLDVRLRGFGGIRGSVVLGDRPVVEASVHALGEYTQTDDAGTFDIDRLPSGRVNIQVNGAVGGLFRSVETEVVIGEGRMTEVVVDLSGGGTRVTGVVRWGGRPLADAIVLLDDIEGAANPQRTDAAGAFTMPGVPAGPHILVVMSGNQRFEKRVEIPAAESHGLVVDIPGSRVSGRVIDGSTGDGVPATLVARREADAVPAVSMESDGDGRFVMDGAPAGRLVLRVDATGYETAESTHTIAPGQLLDGLTITLHAAGEPLRVFGVVRLPDGRPAYPATVGLSRDSAYVAGPVVTDPSGAFNIPDVVPGRYDVIGKMGSWGPALMRDVEVGDDTLEVALRSPAMLRVRVHRSGEPLVGAHVAVQDPATAEEQLSSPEGIAFFGELMAGTVNLRVSSGADVKEQEVSLTEGVLVDVAIALGEP